MKKKFILIPIALIVVIFVIDFLFLNKADDEDSPIQISSIHKLGKRAVAGDTVYWCDYLDDEHPGNVQYITLFMDSAAYEETKDLKNAADTFKIHGQKYYKVNNPENLYRKKGFILRRVK